MCNFLHLRTGLPPTSCSCPCSSRQGLSHVRPFSLVNDISLLTVLESYLMFGESGSGTAGSTP